MTLHYHIRDYRSEDAEAIFRLLHQENWSSLANNKQQTTEALAGSNPVLVAEQQQQIIGYIRCLTDQFVTLYVAEILVDSDFRSMGIGASLLRSAHDRYPQTRMEMLAGNGSKSYYSQLNFRAFYGFRKQHGE